MRLVLATSLLFACAKAEPPRGAPAAPLFGEAVPPPDRQSPAFVAATQAAVAPAASYGLTASLDPTTHEIHGHGVIRLVNTSRVALPTLWFHLYLNAFKNERSVFMQEKTSGFRGHAGTVTWGFCDVTRLALVGEAGTDLMPLRRPREGNDETELAVDLPEPLAPGADLAIRVEWTSRLPSVVLRTGFFERFHLAGQWFPKLAKLDDAGFVHFPFHRFSEFYADFGDYDVTLDVPQSYVVGATGQGQDAHVVDGRRFETFRASRVHDFAFTAWDDFVERKETIDGVAVRALAPAGHEAVVERELAALRFALPHYRGRYGSYPYPTLTVVHPPVGAGEAGGMEYPTLITTGGDPRTPELARSIEAVTVHEFGHQYFYGLLASNEHQAPFLDEGLNSFAEIDSLERWLGPHTAGASLGAASFGIADVHALTGRRYVHDAHVDTEAASFPTGGAYGAQVYSRTATLLETLHRVYGDERFFAMFGAYTRRFRFRHPTEADLLDAVGAGLGEPARAFLATGLAESGTLDAVVLEAQSQQRREPGGILDGQERKSETGHDYVSTLVVSRRGTLQLPVEVELRFADGSRHRRTWELGESTAQLTEESASELVSVLLDPDRKLLCDDNWENNALVLQARTVPKGRTGLLSATLAALLAEAL